MLEILVASSLVAGLVLTTVRGQDRSRSVMSSASLNTARVDLVRIASPEADGRTDDLPCPWCLAATGENDDRCPDCGQKFG